MKTNSDDKKFKKQCPIAKHITTGLQLKERKQSEKKHKALRKQQEN